MSFNPVYPIDLAFLPPKEPLKNEDFSEVLLKARVELAELKGAAGQIPNPLLLTAPLLVRESVKSSGSFFPSVPLLDDEVLICIITKTLTRA